MLKGVNIGEFDLLLTLESPTQVQNSIGENSITWGTYKQMFSKRLYSSTPENFEADQQVAKETAKFIVRYDLGLQPIMRFKPELDSNYFYITSVIGERREGISTIIAERRDSQNSEGSAEGGDWYFADNSDSFPTSSYFGTIWIAKDEHGVPGDADYIQAGTWMQARFPGASAFADYNKSYGW